MRYLSVCSGIEAASSAWQPLGWTAAGYSEIEPFPRAVLQQRFGAVPVDWDHRHTPQSNILPLFGDFTKIEEHHVGPVDLLVGGTPCQSFSVAGKRLGLDDPRGNLTLEFLALARRVRPRWILWENVPGVLSDDGGKTMGTFLGLVGELGFTGCYRVLDAQFVRVDGFGRAVPQRRRRVFFVGHSGNDARAFPVLFERESLRGHPAPRREAGQSPAPTLAARTRGGGGLGTDFDCDGGLIATADSSGVSAAVVSKWAKGSGGPAGDECQNLVAHGIAPPITSNPYGDHESRDGLLVAHSLRADRFDASEGGTGRGTPPVPICIHADAIGRTGEAINLSPDAEGRMRLRDAGMGVSEGTAFGLTIGAPHAIAFSATDYSTGSYAEVDHSSPLTTGTDQSRSAPVIAIQERAVCENPDAGPGGAGFNADGAAYTLEARHHVQAVAFAQNTRGDGQVAGALAAEPGMKQQSYVAFDQRGRDGGAQLEGPHDTANIRAASGGSSRSFVAETWAVRRLTPRECERLQGFPDDWTLVTYRGKPAADGPRYKSIGNSMAVNCMAWIGRRIQWADECAEAARGEVAA